MDDELKHLPAAVDGEIDDEELGVAIYRPAK